MVWSLGLVLILGFLAGYLLNKIKIPGLFGCIVVGLLIGPYLAPELVGGENIEGISSSLRQIALIIILTRSGLNLDLDSLKKVGRPAILMSFVPATFEMASLCLLSHYILGVDWITGLIIGAVLAAVSPAVVSPRMIKLIENGYGEDKQIPKLVLAGSSVDDIYVIILFYAFIGIKANGGSFSALQLLDIPSSIILGILLGLMVGFVLSYIFKKVKLSTTQQILVLLASSFLMIGFEDLVKPWVKVSALLGIIVVAMTLLFKSQALAKNLSQGYNKIWVVFEVILFVLVGCCVKFDMLNPTNIGLGLVVLILGLVGRSIGVMLCLIKTNLNFKERLFVTLAYIPKATVQASIGAIAMDMGLDPSGIILLMAVLSILITAPVGALLIDNTYKLLLSPRNEESLEASKELEAEPAMVQNELVGEQIRK